MSIQNVRPNSQDTTTFYLANIYQVLADPNRYNLSLPSSPPTFSPPTYAVLVNALWFLSLVVSLTCALLATLLQQWARKYNTAIQPRLSAHMRVRIHAFFPKGWRGFSFRGWLKHCIRCYTFPSTSSLPALLCSTCINLTIFRLVLSWVSVCTVLYGCFTFMPIIRHDSPYRTPLSSLAWSVVAGIPFVILRAIRWPGRGFFSRAAYGRLRGLEKSYHNLLSQGMLKAAEKTARNLPSEIDTLYVDVRMMTTN